MRRTDVGTLDDASCEIVDHPARSGEPARIERMRNVIEESKNQEFEEWSFQTQTSLFRVWNALIHHTVTSTMTTNLTMHKKKSYHKHLIILRLPLNKGFAPNCCGAVAAVANRATSVLHASRTPP